MSKLLVEVHNYTEKLIGLTSNASGRATRGLPYPPGPLGKGKHTLNWEVPDNSNSSKYFADNHTTVDIFDPTTNQVLQSFSFWDDDWKDFNIYYCDGTDWKNTTRPMRGGSEGKDGTKIILHIAERPDDALLPDTIKLPDNFRKYELTAVPVTDDQLKMNIVTAFQTFRSHPDIQFAPGKKYTNDQMAKYMAHPAFKPVMDAAEEALFKSIAVILGGEGAFVVGAEAYIGMVMDLENRMWPRALATAALCVGADFGADGFVGVYVSTAEPPGVAGVEFFAQLAVGWVGGACVVGGISLSGSRSMTGLITLGVEVDMGGGVGYTKVADR